MGVPPVAPGGAGMYPPPARHRSRNGLLIAAGIVVNATIVTLLISLVVVPVYRKLTEPSPTEKVLAAAEQLAGAREVRYTGGVLPGTGGGVEQLDLRVGSDGAALGTVRRAGAAADVLASRGHLYLRGDRDWSLATNPAGAGYQAGKWLTASGGDVGVSVSALAPKKLAHAVTSGLRRDGDDRHQARELPGRATTLHGTAVDAYSVPSGAIVYLGHDDPYPLLGVDGAAGAAGGYLAVDVAVAGRPAAARLSHDVKDRASPLNPDPPKPAWYVLTHISPGHCGDKTCTVYVEAKADGGDTTVPAEAIGLFSTGKGGRHGLGTCVGHAPPVSPHGSSWVSCTDRSAAWANWPGGSGFSVAVYPMSPGWQGDSADVMLDLYKHPGFASATSAMTTSRYHRVAAPAESLRFIDHAMNAGWSATSAIDAADTLIATKLLGTVGQLVDGGHLTLDPDTAATDLRSSDAPAYQEAARRVAAGSATVAVGSWTSGGSTYNADVFDISGHRAVFLGTADDSRHVARQVRAALRTARGAAAPRGFGTEVRVAVGPASPLYRQDRAGMLSALRRAGLAARDLRGTGDLVLVGAGGGYRFHATDFA